MTPAASCLVLIVFLFRQQTPDEELCSREGSEPKTHATDGDRRNQTNQSQSVNGTEATK